MGWRTKIQMVNRKYSPQYFVRLPKAMAEALDIKKGEEVEWKVKSRRELVLKRRSGNV